MLGDGLVALFGGSHAAPTDCAAAGLLCARRTLLQSYRYTTLEGSLSTRKSCSSWPALHLTATASGSAWSIPCRSDPDTPGQCAGLTPNTDNGSHKLTETCEASTC